MRILGYEFVPQSDFNDNLMSFGDSLYSGGSMGEVLQSPGPAMPVYADDTGNEFVAGFSGEQLQTLPFLSGTPNRPDESSFQEAMSLGGFVPVEAMPKADPRGMDAEVLSGVAQNISPEAATGWLGGAAKNAMLGSGPGQINDRMFSALGIENPFAGGGQADAMDPLIKNIVANKDGGWAGPRAGGQDNGSGGASSGGASSGGASSGGVSSGGGGFDLGSLLPAAGQLLKGGAGEAVGGAIGRAGLQQVLKAAGVDFPGASTAANILGGMVGSELGEQVGGLMDSLGLDDLAGGLTDALPGGLGIPGSTPPFVPPGAAGDDATKHIAPGGCVPGGSAAPAIDYKKLGAEALEGAADEALSKWKVDDESSAAESVAHKMVNDNKAQIKEAVKDPDGLLAKIKGYFTGVPAGKGEWAVRMGDLDDKGDVSVMGVGNILFQGQMVSRITDMVAGPMAPPPGIPIAQGKTLVKSAGLATAFRTAKTLIPTDMITGAPTILIDGAVSSLVPPAPPAPPTTQSNQAPPGPKAPPSSESGSAGPEKPAGEQDEAAKKNESENAAKSGDGTPEETKPEETKPEETKPEETKPEETKPEETKEEPADPLGTAAKGGTGASAASGVAKTNAEKDALKTESGEKTAAAEEQYQKGEQARADQERLKNEAGELERSAKAEQMAGGESNKDFSSPAKKHEEAGAKQYESDAKGQQAAQYDAEGNKLSAEAAEIDAKIKVKPKIPIAFDPLPDTLGGRGLMGLGMANDVKDAVLAVGKMEELGAKGEDREVIKTATSTIGSLVYGGVGASVTTAALVAVGVGTGGLGLVVIGGWAIVGGSVAGYVGGAAGEEVGDRIATAGGYENRSGRRDPTTIERGTRWLQSWWD